MRCLCLLKRITLSTIIREDFVTRGNCVKSTTQECQINGACLPIVPRWSPLRHRRGASSSTATPGGTASPGSISTAVATAISVASCASFASNSPIRSNAISNCPVVSRLAARSAVNARSILANWVRSSPLLAFEAAGDDDALAFGLATAATFLGVTFLCF